MKKLLVILILVLIAKLVFPVKLVIGDVATDIAGNHEGDLLAAKRQPIPLLGNVLIHAVCHFASG